MSHKKWKIRIRHILEAIDRIFSYTRGMDFEGFRRDAKTVDAVVRNFQVIGEAAHLVPKQIREKHPEIPWGVMHGLRNVLVHDYVQIRVNVLWDTIQNDLPPLVPSLAKVLEQEPEE